MATGFDLCDDGVDRFLRNVGSCQSHKSLHPRRRHSSDIKFVSTNVNAQDDERDSIPTTGQQDVQSLAIARLGYYQITLGHL
jgi:hypothetical protein